MVDRLAQKTAEAIKRSLLESLRKYSRIYDIHLAYSTELRETSLKVAFFRNLIEATKRYSFHKKLMRNFVRIINRPLKVHAEAVLKQSFNQIKNLKVSLFKPSTKEVRKPFKPNSSHSRNCTESLTNPIQKIAVVSSELSTIQNNAKIIGGKADTPSRSPKPKIKVDHEKNEKLILTHHSSKESSKVLKSITKETIKIKDGPKKLENQLLTSKEPELRKKSTTGVAMKPYSVNSSIDDGRLSNSKLRQSVDVSDLHESSSKKIKSKGNSSVVGKVVSPQKPQGNIQDRNYQSKLIPLVDNENSIISKHMEMKNKLLRQIRGESEDEGLEEDEKIRVNSETPVKPVMSNKFLGKVYEDDSVKKHISNSALISYSRDSIFHHNRSKSIKKFCTGRQSHQ